jgi:hypothetical protein
MTRVSYGGRSGSTAAIVLGLPRLIKPSSLPYHHCFLFNLHQNHSRISPHLLLHHNQLESLHQRIKELELRIREWSSTKQALIFVFRVLVNRPLRPPQKIHYMGSWKKKFNADFDHIDVSYVKISFKNLGCILIHTELSWRVRFYI